MVVGKFKCTSMSISGEADKLNIQFAPEKDPNSGTSPCGNVSLTLPNDVAAQFTVSKEYALDLSLIQPGA